MNTALDSINAALALLPPKMTSDRARAMLLAIGLQESELHFRRQHLEGPARGLWQFERDGGVAGVLRHPATREHATNLCWRCGNAGTIAAVYHGIETDDVLAAGMARLLLWTLPWALPDLNGKDEGWRQYIEAWRPGRPHPEKWAANWARAWEILQEAAE